MHISPRSDLGSFPLMCQNRVSLSKGSVIGINRFMCPLSSELELVSLGNHVSFWGEDVFQCFLGFI